MSATISGYVRSVECGGYADMCDTLPCVTTNHCQGHDDYPLVGSLISALKDHEPEALFYGLVDPTALLHSDIVSSLHAIANAQSSGVLRPQALVVGRTVVPSAAINQAAVAQAVRGDPVALHTALHDLAMHGKLRPADEMDYVFVSRSAWDWDAAPPIM